MHRASARIVPLLMCGSPCRVTAGALRLCGPACIIVHLSKGMRMAVAPNVRTQADEAATADPVGTIPRQYNFAADILDRNLKAGRANKPVFIDPRASWTYGQFAER